MCFRAYAVGASSIIPLLLVVSLGTGWSQTGTVVSNQQISQNQGNLSASLHNEDEFGGAVAHLGDLDGPGPSVAALAVGAIGFDGSGTDRGAVYVLFLDSTGNVLSHQEISQGQGGFTESLGDLDEFGGALVCLGDLDGAGPSVAALAVGAVGDDDGGTNRGAVYILFLDATGSVLSYQKISSTQGGFTDPLGNADEFGGAVGWLGDLDGAGASVAALAVGAIGDDDGGGGRGAVYVLFLDSSGSVLSHQKISDTQGNFLEPLGNADEFGSSTAGLGDLDGGGPSVAALAVGAIGDDDGGADQGATYILFLDATGMVLSYQKISGTQGGFTGTLGSTDEFGGSVANLGDLDGAGGSVTALAVAAAPDDDGGLDRGAVYVLFLDGTGNVLSHQKISSTQGNFTGTLSNEDQFGSSIVALGDLDGEGGGALTLAVGAVGDDDGGSNRGAVHVLALDGIITTDTFGLPLGATAGRLGSASPNPFSPQTTIAFRAAVGASVRIDVWDVRGRMVRRLVDEAAGVAERRATWDGTDDSGRPLPAGAYFYRMTVNGKTVGGAQRVLLLRE